MKNTLSIILLIVFALSVPEIHGQTPETVRIKMVDLYTGAPLANQTFNVMAPLVDDRVVDGRIQRTNKEYKSDATGLITIPTPQFKYGGAITQGSDLLIERLPDGSWLGKQLPQRNDLRIKSGITALSSPDLMTRFVASFNLWTMEINTGENQFTEAESRLLKTYEDKINQSFFDSAVKFLRAGNKGLRRDIFSMVALVLYIVSMEAKMTGAEAQPTIKTLLNKIKLPSAVVAGVIENLRDPDKDIRAVMLRVISANPGPPSNPTIEAVKRLLNDEDVEVRTMARKALDDWKIKT